MILFLILIIKHPSKADTGNIPESKHTGKEMKQENNIKKLHTERKHHKQNPESFLRHRSRKGIKMKRTVAEAETILNQNQFYLYHQFQGYEQPLDQSQYEIQDTNGNVVIDHLSEGQVISICKMLPQKNTEISGTDELMTEYTKLYNTIMSSPDDREEEKALMEKLKDLSVRLTTRYLFENGYTMKKDNNGILSLIVKE